MRDWEVTGEVQKVVTPPTFDVEIRCNPTTGIFNWVQRGEEMKFRHTRDEIHSHIDTLGMFCVSGWIGHNIN